MKIVNIFLFLLINLNLKNLLSGWYKYPIPEILTFTTPFPPLNPVKVTSILLSDFKGINI